MNALVKLKHVATIRPSSVDKKTVEGQIAVRLCNYTDVYNNRIIGAGLEFMEASATQDQVRQFTLRHGDVLITKDSETAEDIAVPAYVGEDLPGVLCGYHLSLVRPHPNVIHPKFLYWCMASKLVGSQAENYAAGITRVGIRSDLVASLLVPLPRVETQKRTADYLDAETSRTDALIAKKRRMIDLLEERRAGLLDRWVEAMRKQHGSVPLRRLVAHIEQGWSPECDAAEAAPDEWGVLKTSAVTTGLFRPEENKRLPPSVDPDTRWQVSKGDLLVVRGSGSMSLVGRATVADPGERLLMLSDLLYRLKLGRGDPNFLGMVMSAPGIRAALEACVRTDAGQTLKLRVEDLKNLRVPEVPEEQQLGLWSDMQRSSATLNQAMERVRRQIALLSEHRNTRVTAAVIGDIDIPEAAV